MSVAIAIALAVIVLVILSGYLPRPAPAAAGTALDLAPRSGSRFTGKLRAATFNVHRGRGRDGQEDLRRTGSVMTGSDIVAVQELNALRRYGAPDQAQLLAEQLQTGLLRAPTRLRWFGTDRANALLTRYALDHWHREPLLHSTGRKYRNLTTARLHIDGRELWVLFTHLTTRRDRAAQLRAVLSRFRLYSPALLLGDLNTRRDDPELTAFLREGAATDALGAALGERDDEDRIDWVLARGMQVTGGGVVDEGASDHPYYWVDLRFTD